MAEKVSIKYLRKLKENSEKVALLTAYDYPTAFIEDKAGVEIILVGDSYSMVVLGNSSTLNVGMTEMLIACKSVSKAVSRAMVIADMPFMSYQPSNALAIENAGRFVSEGGADGVKLEGAGLTLERIKSIVQSGIPVMGHIGFTPQSIKKFGTPTIQGKNEEEIKKLVAEAVAIEEAGAFCLIVECITTSAVREIMKNVSFPVYGIGSGNECDGQILVLHDMLGLYPGFLPKYVKKYAELSDIIEKSIKSYIDDVKKNLYPAKEHTYL